jgi:cytochrome c oxidase subunit II
MGKLQGLWFGLATLVLVVVATYLFATRTWLPPLVSDRGAIDKAMGWSLLITGVVFIATNLLLAWFGWRYEARAGQAALYWHHNAKLEWTWTLVTATIMLGFTVNALSLWAQVTGPGPADALVIEVTGQQFAWNVRYPGQDGIFGRTDVRQVNTQEFNFIGLDKTDSAAADDVMLQNQLFLPEGRPVRIRLKSLDVIHSFFLPQFRVKQDAMPGITSETWFVPQKAGDYEIACAEHCGLGHYRMRGAVHVVPAAELQARLTEATAP